MQHVVTGFANPQESARAAALLSWTSSQMAHLARQIHHAHLDWCQRWGLPAPMPGDVVVHEALDSRAGTALEAVQEATYAELFADVAQSRHPTVASNSLAVALARQASEAWRQDVGNGFEVAQHDAGERSPVPRSWDGRLDVLLPFGKTTLRFAVAANEVHRRLSDAVIQDPPQSPRDQARGAPESVITALHTQPVHLGVHLEPTTLTLGELAALQPGDVIPLQHALSDPLKIHAPDGSLLGGAWLGQADGQVAVRLHGTPHTSSFSHASASR
jgi:flagellar motor switch/type III secretory pathway protein FliN